MSKVYILRPDEVSSRLWIVIIILRGCHSRSSSNVVMRKFFFSLNFIFHAAMHSYSHKTVCASYINKVSYIPAWTAIAFFLCLFCNSISFLILCNGGTRKKTFPPLTILWWPIQVKYNFIFILKEDNDRTKLDNFSTEFFHYLQDFSTTFSPPSIFPSHRSSLQKLKTFYL